MCGKFFSMIRITSQKPGRGEIDKMYPAVAGYAVGTPGDMQRHPGYAEYCPSFLEWDAFIREIMATERFRIASKLVGGGTS